MRRTVPIMTALLVLALVALPVHAVGSGGASMMRAAEPDLILHDAVVLTMDPVAPTASAVAVVGDRIVEVGSDADVLSLAGDATTIVDLDGLTLVPGFIDSHAHWIGDRGLFGVSDFRLRRDKSPHRAIQRALDGGWTSLNELFVNRDRLKELRRLDAHGNLRVRVNAYLPVNYADNKFGMWFSDHAPGEQLGPKLRLAGVKFFIDGCGFTTMYLSEPHRDSGGLGDVYWTRPELRDLVAKVHEAGWQIAAHACGDGAVDRIVSALRRALDGDRTARPRIEHVIVVRDDQLRQMRRLGISPSFQLTFCDSTDGVRGMRRTFGRDRLGLVCRWRDMAGDPRLHAIGSTDSPFGQGPFRPFRPTAAMQALVEGTTRIGKPGKDPPPWLRRQRLTLEQALALLTTAGARGIFAEDELGAIAPGMLADLVVLSEDPRTVPLEQLSRIHVAMVFVGGSLEVCAPGYEDVCPDLPFVSVGKIRIRASRTIASNPVRLALDGDEATWWSAGAGPTQWIELDLRHEAVLRRIKLLIAQDPAGQTTHRVWGKGGDPEAPYVLLHTFRRDTADLEVLRHRFTGIAGIRYLMIETTESPSWVAWRAIVLDTA